MTYNKNYKIKAEDWKMMVISATLLNNHEHRDLLAPTEVEIMFNGNSSKKFFIRLEMSEAKKLYALLKLLFPDD